MIGSGRDSAVADVQVEIWTDIVCPWCGLTTHRLNAALAMFEHADEVEVVHRSFQLNADAPEGAAEPTAQLLRRLRGVDTTQIEQSFALVEKIAHDEGIAEYHVADNVMANTSLAHQFLAHASTQGRHEEAWQLIFTEYFGKRTPVWTVDELLVLADRLDLDRDAAREALESRRHEAEVDVDQAEAIALGAQGVPFLVIDRKYALSGSKKPELILDALRRAWADSHAA